MSSRITQLSSRLQKLTTEYEIAMRSRKEEAAKAVSALSKIAKEDVDLLAPIAPKLRIVVEYTEEDLIQNVNGEVATLSEVMSQLDSYLDARLRFYEDQL